MLMPVYVTVLDGELCYSAPSQVRPVIVDYSSTTSFMSVLARLQYYLRC